jgi:hypothetical protein
MYGKTDLVLQWESEIAFGDFAGYLTRLRQMPSGARGILKTTSYLETIRDKNGAPPGVATLAPTEGDPADSSVGEALDAIAYSSVRASLTDLLQRILSCLHDPQLSTKYSDMRNILEYITDIVKNVLTAAAIDDISKRGAIITLDRISDLVRAAINQRYAGLESHPETLAHSQSPLLCDIGALVSAASAIPYFLFDGLRTPITADKLWAGFVVFGETYSPQWCPADIIALPTSSLDDPIGEWWKCSHEVAHAFFKLLKVRELLPERVRLFISEAFDGSPISGEIATSEIFANWFDWAYVFNRDSETFFPAIWRAWLELPLVWKSPDQYVWRSFAVHIAEDLQAYRIAQRAGPRLNHLIPYLESRWTSFVSLISGTPHMDEFLQEFDGARRQEIYAVVDLLIPLLIYLENRLGQEAAILGLSDRYNPEYPALDAHVRQILAGELICEDIPSPSRLNIELLRALRGRTAGMAAQSAYVFSMERFYLTHRRG